MKKGFTLIELMTALSVFLVVMTISMGAILSVFDANRKSQSIKTVMSNLNLAVESMSREMRFGNTYHCEDSGNPPYNNIRNCPNGGDLMAFISSDGEQIVYRLTNTTIEKSTDGGSSYVAVTAPEIMIQNLTFYTVGAGTNNSLQPKVLIIIKGYSGNKTSSRSDFSLQTLVSQRELDK